VFAETTVAILTANETASEMVIVRAIVMVNDTVIV
jgi:hypothetical protein